MRRAAGERHDWIAPAFPRLRAGTFIEAVMTWRIVVRASRKFPRLRAGTFIEAKTTSSRYSNSKAFPRLRAGTFIEAV